MSPNFKDPQTAQWNVTIERQLTSALAARITYSGMNSYRMSVKEDYNAIPPSKQPYVPSPYVDPRAPYQNWDEINYSANAAFPTTRGSLWKPPKGCLTDCTSRGTTPGPQHQRRSRRRSRRLHLGKPLVYPFLRSIRPARGARKCGGHAAAAVPADGHVPVTVWSGRNWRARVSSSTGYWAAGM
jgi:hypothetical protein